MITILFEQQDRGTQEIRRIALNLKDKIYSVDRFIQTNTSRVCPNCRKVCCINKHGYFDYQDLIYIVALGLTQPVYGEGFEDAGPCQFLSEAGCRIERSLRPFRCNWHFCSELIANMNEGPARSLRKFNNKFQELQSLRQEMVDQFFRILSKRS
ncbi:MAG: hypothetical protein ACLPN1_12775 [Dissulfurispiraceae bacterium]